MIKDPIKTLVSTDSEVLRPILELVLLELTCDLIQTSLNLDLTAQTDSIMYKHAPLLLARPIK